MSAACDGAADRLATFLGFSCADANPIVTLRDPTSLANWTLPVLEYTIVFGAVLALAYAIVRLRRDGDPTNLALWVGSLVYLFVIEPPLYFPEWFGLAETPGFMFSHNVFTVQFMFDRLPLYIVAFYPAMSQVAYEIVRRLGVFAGRGLLAGSVCVALVYQAFYEVFDQLGPQLKWWAWNLDNQSNHPLLESVPMNSIWLFATVSFGVLTYLVTRLVGRPTWTGQAPRGWSLTWRTVVAGALAPVGMIVFGLPTTIFGTDDPPVAVQAVILTVEIVLLWIVGGALLIAQWRRNRSASSANPPSHIGFFLQIFPGLYLVVMALLWVFALPDYFRATDGYTGDGTPIGSLPYTVVCFLAAGAALAAAISAPAHEAARSSREPERASA